jgi:hypothetical protein
MLNGYRTTALLYAAVELGIPDLLTAGPLDPAELARQIGAPPEALARLLSALDQSGIIRHGGDNRVSLTSLGRELATGATGSLQSLALVTAAEFLPAWMQLSSAVRTGGAVFGEVFGMTPWEHRQRNPNLNAAFNRWLDDETVEHARSILRAYDFSGAHEITDVGGGHGALLKVILESHRQLRGVLIDLPEVVVDARRVLHQIQAVGRCRIEGGDFFSGISPGSDIYLLKSVLHNWNDADCLRLLQSCGAAMSATSRLLIIERVLPDGRSADASLRLLDLHMLVMFGGSERTADAYRILARTAGLEITQKIPVDCGFTILEAVQTGNKRRPEHSR